MSSFYMALMGSGSLNLIAGMDFTDLGVIDAVNGEYYVNGAPSTIGDIIDLNQFDPVDKIDAGGIRPLEGENAVIVPIAEPLNTTLLTGGYTVVMECLFETNAYVETRVLVAEGGPEPRPYALFSADWDNATDDYIEVWSYNENAIYEFNGIGPASGVQKVAATMTPARQAVCVSGGTVYSHEHPGMGVLSGFVQIRGGGQLTGAPNFRIKKLTFYEPVDDADLPGLTAP
jgi:hypothetical protein